MKKKLLYGLIGLAVVLAIGVLYVNSQKNNAIYTALDMTKDNIYVMYGENQISPADQTEFANQYEADKEDTRYPEMVQSLHTKMYETLKSISYKNIRNLEPSTIVIGLMNKNDTASVYVYDNCAVLANIDDRFYAYEISKDDLNKIIEEFNLIKNSWNDREDLEWYMLLQ